MEVFFDIETRSECDLKRSGARVYAEHESTEIICLAWAVGDGDPKIWTFRDTDLPFEFFDLVLGGAELIAHNAAFERTIMNYSQLQNDFDYRNGGMSELIPLDRLHCTMAQAYRLALPGSLEAAAESVGLDVQKNMDGARIMRKLCKPDRKGRYIEPKDAPDDFQALYEYCKDDVRVCRALWERLPKLPESERELWRLDRIINERGVYIDALAAKRAMAIVDIEKERLDDRMAEITGGEIVSPRAVGQITEYCHDHGIMIESLAKQNLIDTLDDKGLPTNVREVLMLRQEAAKSSTAKLNAMLSALTHDSRVCDTLQYHAATTGRWGGRRIQPQNFPRPTLDQKTIEEVLELLGS